MAEQSKVEKNIVEQTDEIVKNIGDEGEKLKDISNTNGQKIMASSTGEEFTIRPCSISKIPELVDLLSKLDEGFKKFGNDAAAAITEPKGEVLNNMSELILMGLKRDYPEMKIEDIKEKFAITDFPIAYKMILDMNDFLSKMRKITQM